MKLPLPNDAPRAFLNLPKAVADGRTILWADESGFYLLPALLRTLGAGSPNPANPAQVGPGAFERYQCHQYDGRSLLVGARSSLTSADDIGFLQPLLDAVPGKLLLIWDGAPIHRSWAVREFRSQGAARLLQLERQPGYAPELNPDEGV